MRVAVRSTSEIANRAGRILLAEPNLERLGLIGEQPGAESAKLEHAADLASYDVAFIDDDDPAFLEEVTAAGIACVVSSKPDVAWETGAPLLIGANLASGIAPALAAHEAAVAPGPMTIAWTVSGRPLRRGRPVAFPDPVGSLWGEVVESSNGTTRIAAPVQGEWAGAMVLVGADRASQRSVGVADLGVHLEAIALAGGVVSVADGAYPAGISEPEDAAERYLLATLDLGLEVAGFIGSP